METLRHTQKHFQEDQWGDYNQIKMNDYSCYLFETTLKAFEKNKTKTTKLRDEIKWTQNTSEKVAKMYSGSEEGDIPVYFSMMLI